MSTYDCQRACTALHNNIALHAKCYAEHSTYHNDSLICPVLLYFDDSECLHKIISTAVHTSHKGPSFTSVLWKLQ